MAAIAVISPGATRSIHSAFESQAARTPDRIAVVCGSVRLSYRELNERSNRLAHHLRRRGVTPGAFVGLYLDRTVELVVAVLGILKAGGAYVPVDPQYPRERLAFMLEDARAPVMVTEKSLAGDLAIADTAIVSLDADAAAIAAEAASNPSEEVQPDDLAYVIYTSGSTGRPKGTLISHGNVLRLFSATQPWFEFSERDVWTLFHSCAFDFSVWELWGPLFHGGRLVVVPFAVSRTPESFYRLLADERVTVLNQTPSAFRQLIRIEESLGPAAPALSLEWVIFGGEALNFSILTPWFERHGDRYPRLVNMYGITETTVHVTYRPIRADDTASPSVIGVPIPDLQVHLLDEHANPVPAGTAGEIYVGGAGVGRGYWNRPELTAQKFVPDPFKPGTAARLYRSGDLARHLSNGELEYLGRIDQQVKIRGFRIELGEISALLNAHPGVRDSLVVVGNGTGGEPALFAYLIKSLDTQVNIADVRQMLRERLPEYMVPSAFTWIESFPLTVNGKLDATALPKPAPPAAAGSAPQAATGSDVEGTIAAVWREVLQLGSVGLDDNFFDVGGNSVHLATIHEHLQQRLGRHLPITDLFACPTISALASRLKPERHEPKLDGAERLRAQRQRNALLAQRNARRERP